MARFKHTGERLKQLQRDGVKTATNQFIAAAERDLGRSLTPDEMRDIANQAKEAFSKLPVYGG